MGDRPAALVAGGLARARRGCRAVRRPAVGGPLLPLAFSRARLAGRPPWRGTRSTGLGCAGSRWRGRSIALALLPGGHARPPPASGAVTATSTCCRSPRLPLAIGIALAAPPALRARDADRPHAGRGRTRGVRDARFFVVIAAAGRRRSGARRDCDRRDRDPAAARSAPAPRPGRLPRPAPALVVRDARRLLSSVTARRRRLRVEVQEGAHAAEDPARAPRAAGAARAS